MLGDLSNLKSLQLNLNRFFLASGKRLGDRLTAEAVWKNDLASVSFAQGSPGNVLFQNIMLKPMVGTPGKEKGKKRKTRLQTNKSSPFPRK